MKKAIVSASLLLCVVFFGFSQSSQPKSHQASLTTVTQINEDTGLPSFIQFNDKLPVGQLDVWLNQSYSVKQDLTYTRIRTEKDRLGGIHYVYRQEYRNIPVHDAVFIVHTKNNLIESINGTIYRDISLTNDADMSEDVCLQKALDYVDAETYMWEINGEEKLLQSMKNNPQASYYPSGNLEIIPQDGMHRLCYRFDIYSKQPLARAEYYIDAGTGKLVFENHILVTTDVPGSAETKYSGTKSITADSYNGYYRLRESGRGLGIETYDMNEGTSYTSAMDFVDVDNYWNNYNSNLDEVATDAHWATEMTYDFLSINLGRNSIDDAGLKLMSYVHYDNNYVNAFWDGYRMTYGDGSGSIMPLVCVDIVAHEITHGLTAYTANLDYSYESGALNEAFSDIFGTVVEHYAKPSFANWTVGEDANFTIRSLEDPNAYELPDTYQGDYWYSGSGDNGGVHTNNGVLTYWFYLISEGGSGINDNGDAYSVDAIGIADAIDIAYRMLTVYLTNTSDYADARTYAIQSAIDLFGNCSSEHEQVTNAMHAVGIGEAFDNLINANFSADISYSCYLPAEITFTNNTEYSTGHYWDFGDGNTSTEENPVHTYASAGSYTVTLIASGEDLCEGTDTMIQENYIIVDDEGGPGPVECTPEAINESTSTEIGIHNFTINTINHDSEQAAVEGYQDFTCTHQTSLNEGHFYDVSIETGQFYEEFVKIWIDFDGNGQFNNSDELVFESEETDQFHTGTIYIPECELLDSVLRLRVGSDIILFTSACESMHYGQYEDYSVIIQDNTMPPVVDFTANTFVTSTDGEIVFQDLTQNLPDTLLWHFPGATPESSSDPSPVITYDSVGTYSVSLFAENEYGSDSLIKNEYINISNVFELCSDTNITSALSGVLYDSGGPDGDYASYQFCTFLINPGCAQSITMSFNSLDIEPYGYDDYLRVYDGVDESGTLLLEAYGDNIPDPVTATSGSMFITFYSDSYNNYPGFEATWNTVIPDSVPVADFSMSNTNPACNTEVQFTDMSSEFVNQWYWDFGDGDTSLLQNPSHVYSSPGNKTVTLIVDNCYSQDTIVHTIEVQDTAFIELVPAELNIEYTGCADSICQEFSIVNYGMGDLVVNLEQSGSGPSNILALTYGVDYDQEYQYTLAAINQYYTDYILSEINTISSAELEEALVDKDILLIPELESGSETVFESFASVLQEYVANGGNVVICGTNKGTCLTQTGLLEGSYVELVTLGSSLSVLDNMHPLSQGLLGSVDSQNATYSYDFTNSDMQSLVEYDDNTVVGYRQPGQGKVVYVGFDYYDYSDETARIIANAIEWCGSTPVSPGEESDTVPPSDTLIANLCIQTSPYTSGFYSDTIYIVSNDPTNSNLPLPYSLNLIGLPEVSPQDTSLSLGTLMLGEGASDSLIIRNTGCDTLFITSLFTSNPAFSVDMSSLTLAPFSEDAVEISFNPDAIQMYNDTLYIQNNDTDTLIALHGGCIPAPEISLDRDSIYANLNACNDSITIPLTIYNNGGSNLYVSIPDANSGTGGNNVLALTYGVDYDDEYSKMLNAINQYYTDYELSEVNTTNPSILEASLENKNALIIPEQVSGASYVFSNFADVLQQYVENGGTVIFCGTYNDYCVFETGLLEGTYNGFLSGGMLTVQDTTHHITNGVGTTVEAMSTTYYNTFTNPDIVSLVEYNNQHVVALREVNDGKVIYMGFDFYYYNDDIARLMANAVKHVAGLPEWIDISHASDTISAMDSAVVNITLSAEGLVEGAYSDSIIIQTNDPLNPSLTVPVGMMLNGAPEITPLNTSINFQAPMVGTQVTDSLVIKNTGCDTLDVTGFSTSNPAFSFDQTDMIIPPFSGDTLEITFSPAANQIYDDTLFIQNNDTDTMVMLYGVGMPAPEIAVDPDSVYFEINPCDNASVSFPVTIQNTGAVILNTSHELYAGTSNDTLQLLALTYGVDVDGEYLNTIQSINQYFTDYNLTEVYTTDPLVLQDSLNDKDALLIAEFEYSNSSIISGFSDVLQEYVENGGDVIICGTSDDVNLFATGLLDGDYYNGIGSGFELNVQDTTHPLTTGIGTSINSQTGTYMYDFTNPSFECLIDYNGHDVVGYREMGGGRVTYVGFDYYVPSDETARIIANAVQSVNQVYQSTILNVQSDSLSISADSSEELLLTANASGVEPGTYVYDLVLSTNDPASPEIEIPCVVNIGTQICADFSYSLPGACSGVIHFVDHSINNPTIWQWDFGDGNYSDLQNPDHTYEEPGDYTVQLIAQNGMHSDTTTQVISLDNVYGPLVTSCNPGSYSGLPDYGINGFSLNQISNFTGNVSDTTGYSDFTCDYSTNLVVSDEYDMYIEMVNGYNYDVWAWIDYNNNATFESNELVLEAQAVDYVLNTPISIPEGQVLDTPLRMRICCDLESSNVADPCGQVFYGEYEDYTVVLENNITPPDADFSYTELDACQGIFHFEDESHYLPDDWLWDFGDGTSSSYQNPYHTFALAGSYDVTLSVSNENGVDQVSKTINVHSLNPEIQHSGELVVNQPIEFSSNSLNVSEYIWDFGDGDFSNQSGPIHSYADTGSYMVTLDVINYVGCEATAYKLLDISEENSNNDLLAEHQVKIYPNPAGERLFVECPFETDLNLSVLTVNGKEVMHHVLTDDVSRINIECLSPGLYILSLSNDKISIRKKLTVM